MEQLEPVNTDVAQMNRANIIAQLLYTFKIPKNFLGAGDKNLTYNQRKRLTYKEKTRKIDPETGLYEVALEDLDRVPG